MNVHHLELFYFVAKHGGIAAAVRNIPYGIQQPAVSGQIAKLEESLGTKLFQRRPFALSRCGLFEFIKPFFDNIETVAEKPARMLHRSESRARCAARLRPGTVAKSSCEGSDVSALPA
jgi:DNA-binding transcriptional LysR family regulator